ncbi:uncharacterized protein LOC131167879 isoform X1 [Malania oleifera]|uniref:uncharacterized protein LOC131167879 isoform X1 n=1 Tax=Malania oleifera TaxID=397392 RepID=UPI0025AE9011|nr:uncharacterized protein LOC131167879 isoform X1 [Malania oleifera]
MSGVLRPLVLLAPAIDFNQHQRRHPNKTSTLQRYSGSTSKLYIQKASVSASSSSSPLSRSPAENPDQWQGAKRKGGRQRIAGVDQDELLDPTLLADPDSCFCEFEGVQIHHKVCDAGDERKNSLEKNSISQPSYQTKKVGLPMILLHGFGASVFSWNQVMKSLAQVTGSKVLAFDRPAFGLTSRVDSLGHSSVCSKDAKPLNPYSMAFSILATLYFIDLLAAEKAILVGHSAGSLVAINSYFQAPERVAALVLVAPAILAPFSSHKDVDRNQVGGETTLQENSQNSNILGSSLIRFCKMLLKFSEYISQALMRLVKGMANRISFLYKKALLVVLRSRLAVILVRTVIDKFGVAAIQNAWYDSSQVNDHVLYGYTKPLRTKGWDRALVEYIASILTYSAPESEPPLEKKLQRISCPVLLVTGDTDRLVPCWNTERLSRVIPGSYLKVIKHCGHLPHEEKPEDFVAAIHDFLQKVFADSEKQSLQLAS